MKKLVLSLAIIFSINNSCQNEFQSTEYAPVQSSLSSEKRLEQLNLQYKAFLNAGRYFEAQETAKSALDLAVKEFDDKSPKIYASLFNLGSAYSLTGKYKESEVYYLKALEKCQQIFGVESTESMLCLNKICNTKLRLDKIKQAELICIMAVGIVKENSNTEYLNQRSTALMNYGIICLTTNRIKSAEKFFKESLQLKEKLYGLNSENLLAVLRQYVKFFIETFNYNEAEKTCERALSIAKNSSVANNLDTALLKSDLAKLYALQSKYDEAEKNFSEAYSISAETVAVPVIMDSTPYEIADAYVEFLIEIGKYEEAKEVISEAIKSSEKRYGKKNAVELLFTLYLLKFDSIQSNIQEFEKYKNYVEDLAISLYGKDCNDYARVLANIGIAYEELGDAKSSELIFRRILAIKDIGKEILAKAYFHLGAALKYQNRNAEAQDNYRKAVEISEEQGFNNSLWMAYMLRCWAESYYYNKEYGEAEKLLLKADLIFEDINKSHPDRAVVKNSLGFLYQELSLTDKAESNYLAAETILQDYSNISWWKRKAEIYHNLGMLYLENQKYENSIKYFKLAQNMFEKNEGQNNKTYVIALFGLAEAFFRTNNYADAEKFFLSTMKMIEKYKINEYPYYEYCLRELEELYKITRQDEKYKKIEKELLEFKK